MTLSGGVKRGRYFFHLALLEISFTAMGESSPYAAAYESATSRIHHDESTGSDPDALGRKIAKTLDRKRIPFRKRIASPDQHAAVWIHRFLGARVNSAVLRKYYIK